MPANPTPPQGSTALARADRRELMAITLAAVLWLITTTSMFALLASPVTHILHGAAALANPILAIVCLAPIAVAGLGLIPARNGQPTWRCAAVMWLEVTTLGLLAVVTVFAAGEAVPAVVVAEGGILLAAVTWQVLLGDVRDRHAVQLDGECFHRWCQATTAWWEAAYALDGTTSSWARLSETRRAKHAATSRLGAREIPVDELIEATRAWVWHHNLAPELGMVLVAGAVNLNSDPPHPPAGTRRSLTRRRGPRWPDGPRARGQARRW
ncbi:hypothetical protein [Myceligenerans crystallogenes]|uniref:Uncharacterized protein n=1 Tax=Myceligenerans crystallogenes TaxID=316335 RepID=A0ABP4ZX38_9MICO